MEEIKTPTGGTVVMLVDTFCATGCSYCHLATREKNPASYGYEKLNNLMKYIRPKSITVYAGDTFYNHDNIKKAYEYALSIPSVLKVQSVSEIQKLYRDFDIRTEIFDMCLSRGKNCGVEFSLDLAGTKSGNYVDLLNAFYAETGTPISFTCVLTMEQVLTPDIDIIIKEYMNTYKGLNFLGTVGIALDYNSALTRSSDYNTILNQVEKVFAAFYGSVDIMSFKGLRPQLLSQRGCLSRQAQTLVKYDGMLSTCGKVRPDLDITPISALDMSRDNYETFYDSKLVFQKEVNFDICETCEAKNICVRCPKFILQSKNFDGTADTCMFYKSMVAVAKRRGILL